LPVLLGLPYSLGVLRTADHFTTRSPHRHAGARSRASSMASRIKSRSNTNATPQQNSDSTRRGRDSFRRNNFQDPDIDFSGPMSSPGSLALHGLGPASRFPRAGAAFHGRKQWTT
jgi:hypothetical protein